MPYFLARNASAEIRSNPLIAETRRDLISDVDVASRCEVMQSPVLMFGV